MPTTPEAVLVWVTALAGVDALLRSLPLLATPALLSDSGLRSWPFARDRWGLDRRSRFASRAVDAVMSYPAVMVVVAVRAAGGLLLVAAPFGGTFTLVGTVAVWGGHIALLEVRTRQGLGADVMTRMVSAALLIEQLAGGSALAAEACVWFLAGLSCLSYVGNGWAKLRVPAWRSGEALSEILATPMFRVPSLARVVEARPAVGRLLSWSVLGAELLFPLGVALGEPAVWLVLAWGVAFHATNAVSFGLGPFFWAFISPYPAVWYAAQALHS